MIDLNKTLLIVMAYPDGAIPHRTLVFFHGAGLPLTNVVAINKQCSVVESRNRTMKEVVVPRASHYEWFIFIDKDNVPTDLTSSFLDDVNADVVGCTYDIGDNKSAWLTPDNFHMGLSRIRGETILKLQPPWFMFGYNEDGTQITNCECGHFRNKLIEQNAIITRRGWCSHESGKGKDWHASC